MKVVHNIADFVLGFFGLCGKALIAVIAVIAGVVAIAFGGSVGAKAVLITLGVFIVYKILSVILRKK